VKITVITVCFNSAATIADTLDSVAVQLYEDVEHIVIDGGSTDGTLDIVHAHGRRVAQLASGPDQGIYDAMNKGIALATGDYVGFLNADDVLEGPDALSWVARYAAGRPVAIFGDLVYVRQRQVNEVVRYWRSGGFSRRRLQFGWMPPHPTFYVRRDLLPTHGAFDLSLRISADYDFMMRFLSQRGAQPAYIPRILVRMRLGGVSNASLRALLRKSAEDLKVIRRYRLGGWWTLICKNVRKSPQFFISPPERRAPGQS